MGVALGSGRLVGVCVGAEYDMSKCCITRRRAFSCLVSVLKVTEGLLLAYEKGQSVDALPSCTIYPLFFLSVCARACLASAWLSRLKERSYTLADRYITHSYLQEGR